MFDHQIGKMTAHLMCQIDDTDVIIVEVEDPPVLDREAVDNRPGRIADV